jgi:hypothetical protein
MHGRCGLEKKETRWGVCWSLYRENKKMQVINMLFPISVCKHTRKEKKKIGREHGSNSGSVRYGKRTQPVDLRGDTAKP